MDAVEVYTRQLTGVNGLLHGFIDGLRPGEWESRPTPGTNTVGFNVWHIAAIQDWAINTWFGARPGLNTAPEWATKGMAGYPAPFGMTLAEADAIANAVAPADVLDYADAVLQQSLAWLGGIDGNFLDTIPDSRAHLPLDPVYATPGYRDEVEGMFEYPVWRILSGACYGHIRGHFGELDLTLHLLRQR